MMMIMTAMTIVWWRHWYNSLLYRWSVSITCFLVQSWEQEQAHAIGFFFLLLPLIYETVISPGSHGNITGWQSEGHPGQVVVRTQLSCRPEQGPKPRPPQGVFPGVFRAPVPGFERSEPDQPTSHSAREAHPLLSEHRHRFQCPHILQVSQPVTGRSPLPNPARSPRLQESRPAPAEVPHEQLHLWRRHAKPLCRLQGECESGSFVVFYSSAKKGGDDFIQRSV